LVVPALVLPWVVGGASAARAEDVTLPSGLRYSVVESGKVRPRPLSSCDRSK
jgi:hypothetical protein